MENKNWPIFKLYSSTLLSVPFENILILMQIQHNLRQNANDTKAKDEGSEPLDDRENRYEDNERVYHVDASGYLIQHSPTNYQIGPIKSITSAISNLVQLSSEGLLSLWKGHHLRFLTELLHITIQPILEGFGLAMLKYDSEALILTDSIQARMVVFLLSHTITGIILVPIELFRVGLVARSLKKGMRWPRIHWESSILYHLLSPLFENMIPVVVDRVFHCQNTLLGFGIELGISVLELVVMMPLETIRNRLAAQRIEGVVQQDPIPYTSAWDCCFRLVMIGGIGSLYRGFGNRFGVCVVHVLLRGLTLLADKD